VSGMDDPEDLEDQVRSTAVTAFTLHVHWSWNKRPIIQRVVRLDDTRWLVYFDLLGEKKDYVFIRVSRLGETLYASCGKISIDGPILRKRLFDFD
jgi:hypothetical protein